MPHIDHDPVDETFARAGDRTERFKLWIERLRTRDHVFVIDELQQPRRAWSSSEDAVMQWAAHFWHVDRWPAKLPYAFEEFYFRRWITACHLYKKIPPALTITHRSQR